MTRFLLILTLCTLPWSAMAHKVVVGVFPAGDSIEGELGFSNGDMAVDTEVIILAPGGRELGRTKTDSDGYFTFTPREAVAHRFQADLGAGHVANVTMSAEDVSAILSKSASAQSDTKPAATTTATPAAIAPTSFTADQQAAIAEAVRNEIRPLRREISAYREHHDLQTILGGIGYIIGLFGFGFYLAARRKLAR